MSNSTGPRGPQGKAAKHAPVVRRPSDHPGHEGRFENVTRMVFHPTPVDERRLEAAVETTERAIEASGATLTHAERAKVQAALYELIGREGQSAARVRTVLDLLAHGRAK